MTNPFEGTYDPALMKCPVEFRDGPYLRVCGRLVVDGKCPTHGDVTNYNNNTE